MHLYLRLSKHLCFYSILKEAIGPAFLLVNNVQYDICLFDYWRLLLSCLPFVMQARKGRTTIVVAHRLSTIKTADIIYGLRDGTVHESGIHSELMEHRGIYHELVTHQVCLWNQNFQVPTQQKKIILISQFLRGYENNAQATIYGIYKLTLHCISECPV